MEERLSRMNNMYPSTLYGSSRFKTAVVIVFIVIVINKLKNLITFFTSRLDKESMFIKLRKLKKENDSLVEKIANMKISPSMSLERYEHSKPFTKLLTFVESELRNEKQVKDDIKKLEKECGSSPDLRAEADAVYMSLETQTNICVDHVKSLNLAVKLIKNVKKLCAGFEEIKDEKTSKPETEQNDKKSKEKNLRKELSDFLLELKKDSIAIVFEEYMGDEKDVDNLLDAIKHSTNYLGRGLCDETTSLESKVKIYIQISTLIQNSLKLQRTIDSFGQLVKNIKININMNFINYKEHVYFSEFLDGVEAKEKALDGIENSLDTLRDEIGEGNKIYLDLLEQVESKSSLPISKKTSEEHVEALNYAATLIDKVKNLEKKTHDFTKIKDSEDKTYDPNIDIANIKKELSSLREELKKLNEDSKEGKLKGYKGSPDDVKNLTSELNDILNEIEKLL